MANFGKFGIWVIWAAFVVGAIAMLALGSDLLGWAIAWQAGEIAYKHKLFK